MHGLRECADNKNKKNEQNRKQNRESDHLAAKLLIQPVGLVI